MALKNHPCLLDREAGDFSFSPAAPTVGYYRNLLRPPRVLHRGRRGLFAVVSIVCLGFAAACSRATVSSQRHADPAAIVYTDGIGRSVTLPRHPVRIISLAPSVTEVLYMVGAEDRLVGVTTESDWPDDALGKPKIGTLLNPSYERILEARPDLVIASTAGNDRAAVYKLAELGLPVFVTAPRSVAGILETTLDIGRITDRASAGERLVAQMKDRLDRIKRRLSGLPPTRAFFITWFDPLLAPGHRTFENDILSIVDVDSISAGSDEFYPRYSLEQVVAQDPDVILTVFHSGQPLPDLKRLAGWSSLRAVREGRVYVLSETLQHPSPRFVDAVEDLARRLHPERLP